MTTENQYLITNNITGEQFEATHTEILEVASLFLTRVRVLSLDFALWTLADDGEIAVLGQTITTDFNFTVTATELSPCLA